MSSSPEFVDVKPPAAAVRSPEKSSFSQTCSLLSQYLKGKLSSGDLSPGMASNNNKEGNGNGNGIPQMRRQMATTMNLFPVNGIPGDVLTQNIGGPMDLFPQQSGFAFSAYNEDLQVRLNQSVNKPFTAQPQTSQMTIFYDGQVIVFNDFPAEKAKEVMLLASQGTLQGHTAFSQQSHPPPTFAPSIAKTQVESSSSVPVSSHTGPNFGNGLIQEQVPPPPRTLANDLPIARRASLHRFLEKRKDRITARAPYQTSIPPPSSAPSKLAESKSWLGLAAQSSQ